MSDPDLTSEDSEIRLAAEKRAAAIAANYPPAEAEQAEPVKAKARRQTTRSAKD